MDFDLQVERKKLDYQLYKFELIFIDEDFWVPI